jgi:hypothetical protein
VTEAELKTRFPNATVDFLRLNAKPITGSVALLGQGGRTPAVLERDPGDGTVAALPVQKRLGRKFLVRIKSYRKRLLDEDNLCEKFHVDLCRYAGILPGDEAGTTKIEVCQEKVGPKEPERVVIEVFEV